MEGQKANICSNCVVRFDVGGDHYDLYGMCGLSSRKKVSLIFFVTFTLLWIKGVIF